MKKQSRNGSAILTVLGIISVISVVCAMLGFMASQQMHAARVTRELMKARLIAESGLNKAYATIRNDFSKVANYADKGAFGDGTYTVKAVPVDGSSTKAQLVAEGTCGVGHSVVSADLENRPKTTSDDDAADDYFELLYDLLVGGVLDMKGNFKANVTTVFANGDVTIQGSAETDSKTVASAGTVTWKKPDGTVTLLSNQSPVEVLTDALVAAINSFIEFAEENGAVYASGSDIPSSPPGGVAYCTGDASGWSRTGDGCFIFAGDVSLQGKSLNVSSVDDYPAIIVLGTGEVHLNAGTEVHGAIIIPNGSMKINGHAALYGAILVGQGVTGVGTADIYSGTGQGFSLPEDDKTTDNVVVTAWH